MEVVVTTGAVSRAKAPVKSSPPTKQRPAFYRPDALPVTQPTVSKQLREKYHIPWTCLPEAHLGSSNFVSDHWLPWGRVAMPLISPLMPVPHCVCIFLCVCAFYPELDQLLLKCVSITKYKLHF